MDVLTHLPECDDRSERRDELLAVSAALLGTQQSLLLSGMIRTAGTETEIKLTPIARHYVTAAVMLAKRLVQEVDAAAEVERRVADETPEPLPLAEIDGAA